MSLSTTSDRTCWQCHTPIQGRADKKFCSSACKASHSREVAYAESTGDVVAVSQPSAASRPQPVSRPPEPELIDWQTRCAQAEQALLEYQQQAAQSRQAAVPFDQEYARLGQLLMLHTHTASQWTALTLHDMLSQLQAGMQFYQQHPGLTDPLHVAHRRLQDMQQVSTYLQQNASCLLERKTGSSVGGA